MHAELIRAGAIVATVYGVDDALDRLEALGRTARDNERTTPMNGIECAFAGRLVQDVELKTSAAGKSWAALSVSVGEGEALQWVRVAVFGTIAETTATIAKGASIYVEGRIKLDKWTTKDGEPRSGLSVAATRVEALGQIGRKRPPKISKAAESDPRKWQRPFGEAGSPANRQAAADGRAPMKDDPIPF